MFDWLKKTLGMWTLQDTYNKMNCWCWNCLQKIPYRQPFCVYCNTVLLPAPDINKLEVYFYGKVAQV